jgi:hypothetical protein
LLEFRTAEILGVGVALAVASADEVIEQRFQATCVQMT